MSAAPEPTASHFFDAVVIGGGAAGLFCAGVAGQAGLKLLVLVATLLTSLRGRVTAQALRNGIRHLCTWPPLTVDQLATFLNKERHYLRNKHLIPMVREGQLRFRYPESAKHPHQAYVANKEADKA